MTLDTATPKGRITERMIFQPSVSSHAVKDHFQTRVVFVFLVIDFYSLLDVYLSYIYIAKTTLYLGRTRVHLAKNN